LTDVLFGDVPARPASERNLTKAFFFEPDSARRHFGVSGSEDFATFAVSQLRGVAERYPHDSGVRKLIAELRSQSIEFERRWHQVDVVIPRHQIKSFTHDVVGPIELHCDLLMIPDRDQLAVLCTAEPGTSSHRALSVLASMELETSAGTRGQSA